MVKEVTSSLFLEGHCCETGHVWGWNHSMDHWDWFSCEVLLSCSSYPSDSSLPVKVSGGGQELHALSLEEGFLDPTLPWLQSKEKRHPGDLISKALTHRRLRSGTFSLKLIIAPSYSYVHDCPTGRAVSEPLRPQTWNGLVHTRKGRSAPQWFAFNNGLPQTNKRTHTSCSCDENKQPGHGRTGNSTGL